MLWSISLKNDYHVIFCGYDKFDYLKFLKKEIEEKKFIQLFHVFNYLEDEEIIVIYLNSHALVMPHICRTLFITFI